MTPSRRSMHAVVAILVLMACGRTQPVHYSWDASDEGAMRGTDGGLLCLDGTLALDVARPVVTLLVDRSASMNQAFLDSNVTKWSSLRSALHRALPPWNESLQLGLQFFPSRGSSSTSCSVATDADLSPALQSVPQLLSVLDSTGPAGSTPTALAIEKAGAGLRGLRTASAAKAVILATDGAPDCSSTLDPRTCTCVSAPPCSAARCLDDTRTIERIKTLASSGIPTWVIGLRSQADEVFVEVLNRMATAGGQPQSGTQKFFSASSASEIESALTAIRSQVGRCHYLTRSVPDVGGSIEVHLDDMFVPYDEHQVEGWSWIDAGNGELALFGASCDRAERLPLSALSVVVACASR